MAVVTRMSDQQLLARYRAGDDEALAIALRRYQPRLLRFARRILGDRSPNAEDVVQEALLRTHLVLRRGDRALDLGPWLFKLVRNCALDELARVRAELTPLDDAPEPAAAGADPADVSLARGHVRDTLSDVAALPDLQRHALLRRELEGAPHVEIAAELGISEAASRVLVLRARSNLVKARAGRNARCDDIREQVLLAEDARRRATAHVYRHLAACAPCREFRSELRRRRADLRVLVPGPVLLGVLLSAAVPAGSSKLITAGAMSVAVAGGALGIDRLAGPGSPAPVTVRSAVVPGGVLPLGSAVPQGTAVVTRTVATTPGLPVGRYRIACPPGHRVAGLQPTTAKTSHAFAPETIVGASTAAVVLVEPTPHPLTIAVVCKRPGADGSILAAPVTAPGRPAAVCVDRVYLRRRPGGPIVGSLTRGQPVTIRATRDGWRRVTADSGARGWLPADRLCAR
ncbi:sigma-70 family RNA polymerase sigma factor [Solirubrobacter sp. CPCC 204708]|uniref:Sigma-70 family RNA polymerase sigma factor n=1 Tax=Solirubrobacter deserti TaxID=2282478 RepID=A0ABT4RHB0_9ACTN|nr:sigma-70 family RNA polymerase sigma factor [Solirubrobacter deserti]MBE2315256.1 sigma-70 family RNA polymerase sigma factor [Solirubrobacter deserti]MDA0137940.1 sigma-70 family RNA polymerase sigma factor [Solirubrobacter deserti]